MHKLDDSYFLQEAYKYAMQHSTDPSTQNGSCLVSPNGEILAYGANHFAKGVKETLEQWKETVELGDLMLQESGIDFKRVRANINGVIIRFNGKLQSL